jgi:hypothetical protein
MGTSSCRSSGCVTATPSNGSRSSAPRLRSGSAPLVDVAKLRPGPSAGVTRRAVRARFRRTSDAFPTPASRRKHPPSCHGAPFRSRRTSERRMRLTSTSDTDRSGAWRSSEKTARGVLQGSGKGDDSDNWRASCGVVDRCDGEAKSKRFVAPRIRCHGAQAARFADPAWT